MQNHVLSKSEQPRVLLSSIDLDNNCSHQVEYFEFMHFSYNLARDFRINLQFEIVSLLTVDSSLTFTNRDKTQITILPIFLISILTGMFPCKNTNKKYS